MPIDTAHVTRVPGEPYWCKVKMECTKMDLRFPGKAARLTVGLNKSNYIQWLAFISPDWHSHC